MDTPDAALALTGRDAVGGARLRMPAYGWRVPLALAVVLAATAGYSYLLFHSLAELFAIAAALLAAVVGWQSYPLSRNDFLMYLATGYFWVAMVDLGHTLVYKGMGVLPIESADPATQLWIGARYLEALLLLTAPLFLTRRVNRTLSFGLFGALSATMLALVITGLFPAAYVEPGGLTPFKIYSEYLIVVLVVVALGLLWSQRRRLDPFVLQYVALAIGFKVVSELAFTLYVDVTGTANLVGHIAKLVSYWFIYMAVVEVTLTEPFRALARDAGTYDAIPQPTVVVGPAGDIRQVNAAARCFIREIDGPDVGSDAHTLLHDRTIAAAECPVCRRLRAMEPADSVEIELPQRGEWHVVTLSPMGGEERAGMVHVSTDITARKKAEMALQDSERKYRAVMENADDGIIVADMVGNIVDANRYLLRRLGYTKAQFTRMTVRDIHPPEEHPRLAEAFERMSAGAVTLYEHPVLTREGAIIMMEAKGLKLEVGGRTLALGVFRDISERKRAEAALRRSEDKYRTLVENLPQSVFIKNSAGVYLSCNRNYADDLGIAPDEIMGRTDADFHPPELARQYAGDDAKVIAEGRSMTIEEPYVRDGETLTVQTVKTPVRDDDGAIVGVLGIFWDVTEQKRAERKLRLSEARYRAVVEDQTELIVRFDRDCRIGFVNEAFCRYVGRPRKGLIGTCFHDYFDPGDRERVELFIRTVAGEKAVGHQEFRMRRQDGDLRWNQWTVRAIAGVGGGRGEYQAVGHDVTEHRRSDEELRRSLDEKEVLLREIHHRVKNNMQVVSSLLGLDSKKLTDPAAAELFKGAEQRIRSMALVHERLYRYGDLANIDFAKYLQDLVAGLMQAYAADGRVRQELDLESVAIPIDLAIPLGLVVNELVSNALKHAFPDGREGTLGIRLRGGDAVALDVTDDGVGLPASTEEGKETLGLKLVHQLVRTQLHGTVEASRDGGTRWSIRIERP